MLKKRRKFDYRKKSYSNPFFQTRKRRKLHIFKLGWSRRLKWIFFLISLIFISFAWFIYFSSYYTIRYIIISGNKEIQSNEIEELIWQQTKSRRFLIGTQKNINLFNVNKLIEILNNDYYFENLSIEKDLPSTIKVSLEEKSYSLIWYELENYYYIDSKGKIISEADTLEIKQKSYPLIENRSEIKISNNIVSIDISDLNYIIQLFKEFKNNYKSFKIDRFIIDSDDNTVKVALFDGPLIYFNTQDDINGQINKLLVIVNEKLKDDINNKKYIDLRYGDRVYYR